MRRAARMTLDIPEFALYGEPSGVGDDAFVHIESIEARSARYDWHIDTHRHLGLFQVLCLFDGTVQANLDDQIWHYAAPVAITVQPSTIHSFRFSADTRGYVLTMAQSLMFDTVPVGSFDFSDFLCQSLCFELSGVPTLAARVQGLLEQLEEEFRQAQPGHTQIAEWLMRSVLLLLARRHRQNHSARHAGSHEFELFMRFRNLVESHFREQWAIPSYLDLLHVTESKLNRLCKRIAGVSAFELMQRRLMLEARRQLTYIPVSVADIAYTLGFQDPAYFCRVFKRHTGVTPTEFRHATQSAYAAQAEIGPT